MERKNVSAEIISVGTELLLGHIANTNAQYISQKLAGMGINVYHHFVVGDNPGRVSQALKSGLQRSDIIITTGGLGPTVDDITVPAVSQALCLPLEFDKKTGRHIKGFFKRSRIRMHTYVMKQAYVPKGSIVITNPVGTAPAVIIELEGRVVVLLPGPPRELTPLFEHGVMPFLIKRFGAGRVIFTRTIRTSGAAESVINEKARRFLEMKGDVTAGIYAKHGEVEITITAKSKNKKEAISKIHKIEKQVVRLLGKDIYGFDGDTLEEAVGKMLAKKRLTISIAESCTGGLLSSRITDVPGSSKYFTGGIVAYSNGIKSAELGVAEKILKNYGAVSRRTAIAMAKGMLAKTGTDVALAITGIAGPAGGTRHKPVGLVFIAFTSRKNTVCVERLFRGNRLDIKKQAATSALDLLRRTLING